MTLIICRFSGVFVCEHGENNGTWLFLLAIPLAIEWEIISHFKYFIACTWSKCMECVCYLSVLNVVFLLIFTFELCCIFKFISFIFCLRHTDISIFVRMYVNNSLRKAVSENNMNLQDMHILYIFNILLYVHWLKFQ